MYRRKKWLNACHTTIRIITLEWIAFGAEREKISDVCDLKGFNSIFVIGTPWLLTLNGGYPNELENFLTHLNHLRRTNSQGSKIQWRLPSPEIVDIQVLRCSVWSLVLSLSTGMGGWTVWSEAECSLTHVSTGFRLHKIGRHCFSNNLRICFDLGLKSKFGDGFQRGFLCSRKIVDSCESTTTLLKQWLSLETLSLRAF